MSDDTCRTILLLTLFASIHLFMVGTAHSGGPVHGAKAVGMGSAFVAVADDPSAILHNPGGLTLSKGTQVYGGITAVIPSSEYESDAGDSEKTEFQVFFPPHLYISSDFGMESIVLGLGIYSPFGIGGRKWPKDGLTRYVSVEGFMATVSVNPTIAWQVLPNASVAVGVDYMRALNRAKSRLNQSMVGSGDARVELEAEGDGWGYNLGALIHLSDSLRLGLAYRSRIKVGLEGEMTVDNIAPALQSLFGDSSYDTDINTTSTFPEIYSIGIAWFPSTNLVVDVDVEWVRWSSFKRSDLDLDNEVPTAGLTDSSTALDWKDSLQIKIGLDYKVNETLSLRTGYAFINTPVPEHTLSPGNPDADQHNFSIGAGYMINRWTIDVFYNAGFFEDRDVNNSVLSGEYENFIHYAGLSIGRRF